MLAVIKLKDLDPVAYAEFTLLNSRQFYRVKVGNLVNIFTNDNRIEQGIVVQIAFVDLRIEYLDGSGFTQIRFNSIFALWFKSINSL
jgi:hypothetical protein